MSRDITTSLQTALEQEIIQPILFVALTFNLSGVATTYRYFSGYGTLTWDGETWTGTGTIGTLGNIQETQELKAAGFNLQLSGVPSEMQSIALDKTKYQGGACRVWMGLHDNTTHAVVSDPVRIFTGRMDVMTCEDYGETCNITCQVENRLVDMYRARESRWTDQEQRTIASDDKGLEYVAGLQNKEILWGR